MFFYKTFTTRRLLPGEMLLLLPLPLGSKAEEGGVRTDDIYPPFDVVDDAGNGRCRGVNTTQQQQQQQEHHRKVRRAVGYRKGRRYKKKGEREN